MCGLKGTNMDDQKVEQVALKLSDGAEIEFDTDARVIMVIGAVEMLSGVTRVTSSEVDSSRCSDAHPV
jgi:hypothetical protein